MTDEQIVDGISEVQGTADQPQNQIPLLLVASEAAAMCRLSLRTWRSLDYTGRIPRAIRLGHSTRWRADELRAWIAADCPRRNEWEVQKKAVSTQ